MFPRKKRENAGKDSVCAEGAISNGKAVLKILCSFPRNLIGQRCSYPAGNQSRIASLSPENIHGGIPSVQRSF